MGGRQRAPYIYETVEGFAESNFEEVVGRDFIVEALERIESGMEIAKMDCYGKPNVTDVYHIAARLQFEFLNGKPAQTETEKNAKKDRKNEPSRPQ